jgi:hypothetical protein
LKPICGFAAHRPFEQTPQHFRVFWYFIVFPYCGFICKSWVQYISTIFNLADLAELACDLF